MIGLDLANECEIAIVVPQVVADYLHHNNSGCGVNWREIDRRHRFGGFVFLFDAKKKKSSRALFF